MVRSIPTRRLVSVALVVLFTLSWTVTNAHRASAAAWTKSVHAPYYNGSEIEAWADVNTDCEGTLGCWSYIKIERLNPYISAPVRHWEYVDGQWVQNTGWNKITAPHKGGCAYYRTVVDTYNDLPEGSVGVNLGVVELTRGKIQRYHKSSISSEEYICLPT